MSHSHHDKELVLNAVAFLERFGGDVYVDWLDSGMPDITDAETAKIIRTKIDSCSRFVLLATERALVSRWVPWELGYGDAKRTLDRIAILPVRDDGRDYSGSEYLRIYPAVKTADDGEPGVVHPGNSRGSALSTWLRD